MTDKKIIKALKDKINGSDYQCFEDDDVLDLIVRQQEEIDNLRAHLKRVCAERDARICTNNFIKSEAIKEFAERLKNEIISDTAYGCDCTQHSGYYDYRIKIGDIPEYIDKLISDEVWRNW